MTEVEIGIPVYNALDCLPILLDSIALQTFKNFIVCLSIDGDNLDYSNIINIYRAKGLNIRVIDSKINNGPAIARQKILDSTKSKYITFVDADDLIMPRMIQLLYNALEQYDVNFVESNFIRIHKDGEEDLLTYKDSIMTWLHGKMYRVSFLKENNINFLDLRTEEDAYFNYVVYGCTKEKGYVDEITYLWQANNKSITCSCEEKEFFLKTYFNFIKSQIEGLKFLYCNNYTFDDQTILETLIPVYYFYMRAIYYNQNEDELIEYLSCLKQYPYILEHLKTDNNWIIALNVLKAGELFPDGDYLFYEETFEHWANRLFYND